MQNDRLCYGAVNVPVCVLWCEPGAKREYDELILGSTTDPAAWAKGMNADMRLWLVEKADTQALFGERVAILDQQGDWLYVASCDQPTRQNKYGYPGWVPAIQISGNNDYLADQVAQTLAAVSVPLTVLYQDAAFTQPLFELSFQTRLPLIDYNGKCSEVRLPDGTVGYIASSDIRPAEEQTFSAEGIIAAARQFLNLRYLWAGTSAYGFDCSGFTFRLYQSQGITIPRDTHEQARAGIPVPKEELMPGDLVFFADNEGQGNIHHVGMYIDADRMIHASNNNSHVQETVFTAGIYGKEYWGARRYR